MGIFDYTAITKDGKEIRGSIEAESARAARQKLRGQGLFPSDLKEGKTTQVSFNFSLQDLFQSERLSTKSLALLTRQLATLVGAGIPLVESLSALAEQLDYLSTKKMVISVRENVEGGSSLARALERYPKAFPALYVNMVASGETSGSLDVVLSNLADYLESQLALQRKVTSALFYPVLMLGFCGLVVLFLFTNVVPSIVDVFLRQGRPLPIPTRVTMAISKGITKGWPVIILVIIVTFAGFRWFKAQENGRALIDKIMLKLPIIGGIYQKIASARIARTLSTLLNSGVGLLESLEIAKNIASNVHIKKAIDEARDGVKEGKSLARELARSGLFPLMLSQMIAVGERSGSLEIMLNRASSAYENEVNSTLEGLTSIIEPVMIIGLGGVVIGIVASILMPMLDLMNMVGK
jgi:general secretion pathway protein F